MEDTRRMSVLTNIVYVLTDVLETNLMDMEEEFRRRGFALRHEPKRNFNTAIAAIRRLKSDVNKCTPRHAGELRQRRRHHQRPAADRHRPHRG